MTETTTHRMRAKTGPYIVTITPAATPKGTDGVRVTCDCRTHPEGMTAAIVDCPADKMGKGNVHGWVTQAHHPAHGRMLTLTGKAWAV